MTLVHITTSPNTSNPHSIIGLKSHYIQPIFIRMKNATMGGGLSAARWKATSFIQVVYLIKGMSGRFAALFFSYKGMI